MGQTNEELYRQMRKGSKPAFAELYERHGAALFRYALYLSGSRAVAEEVAHETFVQLIGPDTSFDASRGPLENYLFGVVRNLVRVVQRQRIRELDAVPPAGGDLLADLIQDERTATLYAAIRDLPEPYRDAVMLCDLEERTYEEAARIMRCPIGTVRSRVHRARLLLSARLKPLPLSAVRVAG